MPHGLLAELTMHVGDHAAAVEHALTALPVMQRIGASDDELQLRTLLVFCAIARGGSRTRRTSSPAPTRSCRT